MVVVEDILVTASSVVGSQVVASSVVDSQVAASSFVMEGIHTAMVVGTSLAVTSVVHT